MTIFLGLCIKKKKREKKRTKRSRKNMCIKDRDSFLKNKFALLRSFSYGYNLPGWF